MFDLSDGGYLVALITPLRLVLGVTLTLAGCEKIHHFSVFVAGVLHYQILPIRLAHWYSRFLPAAEIVTGILLLLGSWMQHAAIMSTTMFVSFAIAVGINLARKRKIPCFCFGADSSKIGWHTETRILFLLFASLILALAPHHQDVLLDFILDPSISGLINLIPMILVTTFGLLLLSLIEVSPLVVKAWTVRAIQPTHRGYSIVWTNERNDQVKQE